VDRFPVGAFAGRFPAAFALISGSLICDGDGPGPSSCEAVGVDRLEPERFETATTAVACGPESDPVDDCELGLRTITGFLLDAAVLATTFLPPVVAPFPPLAGETVGGGPISAPGAAGIGAACVGPTAGGSGVFAAREAAVGASACCFLAAEGRGGGGISVAAAAGLADTTSASWIASSLVVGGDANRAVGRGPDEEGPLDFFRMGWDGGGLEEDGVNPLLLSDGTDPSAEVSCGGCAGLGP
jgi:hypothetical protein